VETALIFFHGNIQKSAILLNILRWRTLTVRLYNAETIKKIIISKFVIVIVAILMIFSAYVLLYVPPSGDGFPFLNFIMGNLINSYLINAGIIMAYFLLYRKVRNHYLSLQL